MLRNMLLVGSAAEVDVPIPVPGLEGKVDLSSAVPLGPDLWSEFWGDASQLGNSCWGVSADLVGPRMSKVFRPWGATLLRMMEDINVRFRMTVGMCRHLSFGDGPEVPWFHMGARWVNLNGGYGLQE